MGHLLDADQDMLGNGRFLTFETEHLMNLGEKAVVAVLLYLFGGSRSGWMDRRRWCRWMKHGFISGIRSFESGCGIG